MRILSKNEASGSLSEYIENLNNDLMVVTSDGNPIAVLMSLHDVDLETISLSTNPDFLAIIERSRLRDKTEKRVSGKDVRRMFENESS